MSDILILIPARMASTRLPGKPLADICGLPMIIQVLKRAMEAGIGVPVIATDSEEILEAVKNHGGQAIMTSSEHQSGSDRIFEALEIVDPKKKVNTVVNMQGDLPTLDAGTIQACLKPLEDDAVDIATLAAEISADHEITNPNVVKAVGTPIAENRLRALYFSRATVPTGDGPLYHHIGLYAYRRDALERFVQLKPSPLEIRERLEQLRALENGMRIDIQLVDTVPLGVDTPEDLERARVALADVEQERT